MRITFNRRTALRIIRTLRSSRVAPSAWGQRVGLIAPSPNPGVRFTRKLFDYPNLGLNILSDASLEFDVAVPDKACRLQMKSAHNTVYSGRSLPGNSFIEVASGIAISCPELVFLEMAGVLSQVEHLMLGHELCGAFSRDPLDPRNGSVTLWGQPVTSCKRIESFLAEVKWNANTEQAARTLSLLSDNAWSPTESIIAAFASLPFECFGYGLGPCRLNKRINTPDELACTTDRESRVPDILFEGTPVGLNYDGAVHLDLDSVVKAAMALERNPEQAATQVALDAVVRKVRTKAVDDIRRNRELAAAGFIVFPVTKEDLYEEGGLDNVMLQVMKTIENLTGRDLSEQKRLTTVRFCRERRQQLIWSLMPGSDNKRAKHMADDRAPRVVEVIIGF